MTDAEFYDACLTHLAELVRLLRLVQQAAVVVAWSAGALLGVAIVKLCIHAKNQRYPFAFLVGLAGLWGGAADAQYAVNAIFVGGSHLCDADTPQEAYINVVGTLTSTDPDTFPNFSFGVTYNRVAGEQSPSCKVSFTAGGLPQTIDDVREWICQIGGLAEPGPGNNHHAWAVVSQVLCGGQHACAALEDMYFGCHYNWPTEGNCTLCCPPEMRATDCDCDGTPNAEDPDPCSGCPGDCDCDGVRDENDADPCSGCPAIATATG